MAALSGNDLADIAAQLNRRGDVGSIAINRPALRAAVDAIDGFLDSNATAINAAFPQPARGSLTARQKALVLSYCALRRFDRS